MSGTAFCPYCNFDLAAPQSRPRDRWLVLVLAGAGVILAILAVTFFIVVGNPKGIFGGNPTNASPTSSFPTSQAATGGLTPSAVSTLTSTAQAATIQPSQSPPPLSKTPPSCANIGQTWTRPADLMTLACIPAGSFTIGLKTCEFNGCQKEVNGGTVKLEAFWIDSTEVTNAMFTLFVTQTAFVTSAERTGSSEVNGISTPVSGADWRHPQGPGSSIAGMDNYPVAQMNYYSASAYCSWAGGHLPTEAQWEMAARGSDGRLFPWGNAMPDDHLLNAADSSLPEPFARQDQNDGYRYTAPVGSFPAGNSPFGAQDMAGNVWEWTRSLYRDYPYNPGDGREIANAPAAGDLVVIRGGGFFDDYGSVRSTLRYGAIPDLSHDATGFRCVYP